MLVGLTATEALGLWQRVTLAQVRQDGPDLSLRQLAILLQVYLVAPPHTVRGLATTLDVTRPVISRALDTMSKMGLLERVRDTRDRRDIMVKRTVLGALYLEEMADLIRKEGRPPSEK